MEDKDGRPLFSESALWEEAQAVLAEHELDDGLPMVLPTHQRLEAMLEGVADPARSYGMIPPLFGNLTAAAVAYNCVLAGCRPAELPAVLTAAEACLEPQLNLLGVLTPTGTPSEGLLHYPRVPLVQDLGMNSGTNMLGPGNRANATMGRAIALVMRNIGGARALVGDMATMGQPGKYTFCFAEGVDALAPSLAVRRGFNGNGGGLAGR